MRRLIELNEQDISNALTAYMLKLGVGFIDEIEMVYDPENRTFKALVSEQEEEQDESSN